MKLLLDEMHAPGIADSLTEETFDIVAVAGQPGLRGMTDQDLLTCASKSECALVTENVADFMPLAAQWAVAGKLTPA